MRKFILLFFFLNFSFSQTTLMLDKGESNIKYSAKHVLHAWEGVNNDVSGVVVYDEGISKIALAAKVIDFDSGNSGRDSHSLEVLEALKFPNIKFYSEDINSEGNAIIFNGEIEFHGEKRPITVLGSIDNSNKKIKIDGKFQIIPSEFLITLPSFMLIEMEDYLDISFSLYFNK
ncbi:MAG: hypothetical protein CMD13_00110 [Flavobacteriales bacterium]|nr:hypothetical protein [Flavobacteriales bacterium]